MALFIVTKKGEEIEWHIGEKVPMNSELFHEIRFIQADGDELEYIKKEFDTNYNAKQYSDRLFTIPMPRQRVIKWYGDIASTIIGNLF